MLLKIRFCMQGMLVILLLQFQFSNISAATSFAQTQRSQAIQNAQSHSQKAESLGDSNQMINEMKHAGNYAAPTSLPQTASAPSSFYNPNPFVNQAYHAPMTTSPFIQSNFQFSPYNAASMPISSVSASLAIMETPKMLSFIGLPTPMIMPFSLFYPSSPAEPFYTAFANNLNNFEDAMSRGAGGRRHTTPTRDSPIFYMRIPPTPYMLLPNFGYTPTPFFPAFQPVSTFSGLSPTFNLPMSFTANGKPSGIYQMTSLPPNAFQNSYSGVSSNFNDRPSMSSNDFNGNYASSSYVIAAPQTEMSNHDSRMTLLKQPFIFNGRPDEMYILQNNFNPMLGGV